MATAAPEDLDILRDLRARTYAGSGVFWIADGELGVFDPDVAEQVSKANFEDLTLPDRLVHLLLGRRGKPFSWKQVRAAWLAQLRRLGDAQAVARLEARMRRLLDERLDRPLDLVWAAQEVCTRALVPTVLDGLSPADTARVLRDQTFKLARLLTLQPEPSTWRKTARAIGVQVAAGLVARRELRGRAAGRRPRRLDLADPLVDMLPELGMDRAVDAATAALTAIAGPPGAAAACLLYELTRRPDWAERLAGELAPLPPERLHESPTRAAPLTHRFVKETLRMWSPPSLLNRSVRNPIHLDQVDLEVGQRYFQSPYVIHHDPRSWRDPDVFDPDRWLPGAEHAACRAAAYVPFGWAPRACVGAGLGTAQLILLCRLACTCYRIQPAAPEAVRMALSAVPMPLDFRGTISLRPA
jgi:cytochrome P450